MIPSRRIPEPPTGRGGSSLMLRAIAGVLRNAQEGELPLFAWTLGLPQPALLVMVGHCFPELGALEPMPQRQYDAIVATAPAEFCDLAAMLFANRSPDADPQHAAWLAHGIAAASLGSRHLWQDLGFAGRDAVFDLLAHYFEPFYRRNAKNIKWKRFLFAELGALQGRPDLHPPKCDHCDEFAVCFPTSESDRHKEYGNQR